MTSYRLQAAIPNLVEENPAEKNANKDQYNHRMDEENNSKSA